MVKKIRVVRRQKAEEGGHPGAGQDASHQVDLERAEIAKREEQRARVRTEAEVRRVPERKQTCIAQEEADA